MVKAAADLPEDKADEASPSRCEMGRSPALSGKVCAATVDARGKSNEARVSQEGVRMACEWVTSAKND